MDAALRGKKILIDLYKIKDPYTGLGQFSLNFAGGIQKQQCTNAQFDFLVPGNEHFYPNHVIKGSLFRRYFPFLNRGYNMWHSLHQFPAHFPAKGTKHILTIHDLNFLTEKKAAKASQYLKQLQKNINRADVLTCISQYTQKQILQYLQTDKQVHVIYNGVSLPSLPSKQPAFINNARKFFFSVGVFKHAKNFGSLFPLMKHFPEYDLVIAGHNQTEFGRELQRLAAQLGLSQQIKMPGVVTEEEKLWLYEQCEAFLFPSLAEGFGLPVIEAMLYGKPVFLSTATCLPEIGGNTAFYFTEMTEEKMAMALQEGLAMFKNHETEFSQKIKAHAAGFSWERCIQSYLNLYENC